jgi:hypothetical protein
MGVGCHRHTPVALPPGKTQYPLYKRLGGRQGQSGRLRKISPPQEYDPRTVQPVASRYTDWAILVQKQLYYRCGNNKQHYWSPCTMLQRNVSFIGEHSNHATGQPTSL